MPRASDRVSERAGEILLLVPAFCVAHSAIYLPYTLLTIRSFCGPFAASVWQAAGGQPPPIPSRIMRANTVTCPVLPLPQSSSWPAFPLVRPTVPDPLVLSLRRDSESSECSGPGPFRDSQPTSQRAVGELRTTAASWLTVPGGADGKKIER